MKDPKRLDEQIDSFPRYECTDIDDVDIAAPAGIEESFPVDAMSERVDIS